MSILIAAADLGLGTGHAAVGDQDLARELLGFPEDRFCAYLIAIGHQASGRSRRSRRSTGERLTTLSTAVAGRGRAVPRAGARYRSPRWATCRSVPATPRAACASGAPTGWPLAAASSGSPASSGRVGGCRCDRCDAADSGARAGRHQRVFCSGAQSPAEPRRRFRRQLQIPARSPPTERFAASVARASSASGSQPLRRNGSATRSGRRLDPKDGEKQRCDDGDGWAQTGQPTGGLH